MRRILFLILGVSMCGIYSGACRSQGSWESIGPDIGYRPDALFVSTNAIYLGLATQDGAGLGLYRYRFEEQAWELFAFDGYRVTGVAVWGESDENALIIRHSGGSYRSDILRSTDGGSSWALVYWSNGELSGLTQAPSDTSRLIRHNNDAYSSDGGWTWHNSGGGPWGWTSGVSFDQSNALVAYLAGIDAFSFPVIYKSTNGGANWGQAYRPLHDSWGIEVERHQPNHVIGGTQASYIIATTDGGASWSEPAAPFRTKSLCSPPWLPSCFYVGGSDISQTRFEVWRTNDVGGSWSPVGDGLPGVPECEFWWMAMHLEGHPTEAVLYLALEGSGVWQCDAAAAAVPEHTDGSVAKHELALYPNPFHGNVTCSVQVPRPGRISLQLFDTSGRRIRSLREGFFPTGTHRLVLSEADLDPGAVSGIYFIGLSGGGSTTHHRLVYLK